jgi:acetaldehyde dehydrogenase
MSDKIQCAIIGSGNIGTDLMIKIMRMSQNLAMGAMVGIDPASDGLARAARLNVAVTHEGIEGLRKLPNYKDIRIVFDATSPRRTCRTTPCSCRRTARRSST